MKTEWILLDKKKLKEIVEKTEFVYIYGAGMVGQDTYEYLKSRNLNSRVKAFIVTDVNKNMEFIDNVPVITVDQLDKNATILLAATRKFRYEMIHICEKIGASNYIEIKEYDKDSIYYSEAEETDYPILLKGWYESKTGRKLDLDNPITYNEKMQWSKLYERDPRKTLLSDKYKVREYVKEKIGGKYLIPLLGVWNQFEDIDWNKLPGRFVLKCNHGSAFNIFVKDKSSLDLDEVREKINSWMRINYGLLPGLELQYKDIEPLIIAEEFLEPENQKGLDNYKFYCFDGKAKYLHTLTEYQLERDKRKIGIFDIDFNLLPYCRKGYLMLDQKPPKPLNYEEMVSVAERLADDFSQVRVDLYNSHGKIYFGEMTFTSVCGIGEHEPEDFDRILGDCWKIAKNVCEKYRKDEK